MSRSGWINAGLLTIIVALTAGAPAFVRNATVPPGTYVISGRIVDPHNLRPEATSLRLVEPGDEWSSFGAGSIPVTAGGRFSASGLGPGTYVLEVMRQPALNPAKPPIPVGFSVVRIKDRDVKNVVVSIRRDTTITGHFKMESTNPAATWPSHIVVNAQVALDGTGLLGSTVADGAPNGTFVLRNPYGPRIIRCGYSSVPGHYWWPSRVLLDGKDITNVPTDFSEHESARLEVVFTQHPTRLTGIVRNPQGEVVSAPWIVVTSADRALWQWWATTSLAAQGNTKGAFSMPLLPGHYLVRAVPQTTFDSWQAAHGQAQKYASEGVRVTVNAWGTSEVALTLQP